MPEYVLLNFSANLVGWWRNHSSSALFTLQTLIHYSADSVFSIRLH